MGQPESWTARRQIDWLAAPCAPAHRIDPILSKKSDQSVPRAASKTRSSAAGKHRHAVKAIELTDTDNQARTETLWSRSLSGIREHKLDLAVGYIEQHQNLGSGKPALPRLLPPYAREALFRSPHGFSLLIP
jgi:hypothetical protein